MSRGLKHKDVKAALRENKAVPEKLNSDYSPMLIARTLREIQTTESFLREITEGSVWKLVLVTRAAEKSPERTERSPKDQMASSRGTHIFHL